MANLIFVCMRSAWLPALFALISVVVALSGKAQGLLRYERAAIEAGEVWRLITGHFVHLGWSHLWMNLAGLILVWLLVGRAFTLAGWSAVMFATMLGTSAGLWFLTPDLGWYVGLSGVLHGLLVAGALTLLSKQRDALPILAVVAVKVLWEQWAGPLPGWAEAAGGRVIADAHYYGALSGFASWAVPFAARHVGLIRARKRT